MPDVWAIGTLLVFALGVGTLALRRLGVAPLVQRGEFVVLSWTAGLGLTAVVAGLAALIGHLSWFRVLVPIGAVGTLAYYVRTVRIRRPDRWTPSFASTLLIVMLAGACLGALAPTTDADSLAYPIPIAQHLAREGRWQFWSDQALSTFPLSQEMLLAISIASGASRLGLLNAAELLFAALLIVYLARRIASHPASGSVAAVLVLGCPAVGFLAGAAKEDLLLLACTLATAVALSLPRGMTAAAVCGLFAGLAAGAKYSGLPLALAALVCVPFCCGRSRPAASLLTATFVALLSGGLWYFVNLARFGNPVAPFLPAIGHPPIEAALITEWTAAFGHGRGPLDALVAPVRLLYDPAFGGRGNLINPLAYLGVAGALVSRRHRHLLWLALAVYASWFLALQNSRLLLPAVALLSIAAADLLMSLRKRVPLARLPVASLLTASAAIVMAIGLVRFERYATNPGTFLQRETEYYEEIRWMNEHLDPGRDRVATWFKSAAYLRVPWVSLDPIYQVEITRGELSDPAALVAAFKRRHITHVVGPTEFFDALQTSVTPLHINGEAVRGGSRFFRAPMTGSAGIYAIK